MNDPNFIKDPGKISTKETPHDEYRFFNVMPKEKEPSKIVEPQFSTQETSVNANGQASPAFNWQKYKLYFIIGGLLLIVGTAAYFVMDKLGGSSYKSDNILIDPAKIKSEVTQNPENQTVANLSTPKEWRDKYFPECVDVKICGDDADPDRDGLTNLREQQLTSDPNNPDSDQDGLSDGDEINIFQSSPTSSHTGDNPKYNDADFIKGAYDITTNKLMDANKIAEISEKMKSNGLHQPTLTTLQNALLSIYNFTPQDSTGATQTNPAEKQATTSPLTGLDVSIEAKQDRDTQRSSTIKNIELALVKYQADNKQYPTINDFASMYNTVKPYLRVATNPTDPVNKDIYVYSYISESGGKDFTLSFYSEVANQIIKKHAADAQKDATNEQAGIFDDQRKNDLENLRSSLLIYSNKNIAGTQEYVFPSVDKYKTALVPDIITVIPKDPKTGQDYLYQVSETFNTFTLKSVLDNPPVGNSGYLCNQEECRSY